MKQGVVFVVASAVLLAAVATAHVMAPLPDGGPLQASAKAAMATEAASPAPRPVAETTGSRPLIEVRHAPVPLQMRERPPVVLPQGLEPVSVTTGPTASPEEGEGRSFAKTAIEADGYKTVKSIVAGPDGTWRARALRGTAEVTVTVDRDGRVSAD